MSPLYENGDDRRRQRAVIDLLVKRWGLEAHDVSDDLHAIDFAIRRGKRTLAVAEVKVRNIEWGQYKDFRLDKRKVDDLIAAAQTRRCEAYLVVATRKDQMVGFLQPDVSAFRVGRIARTDRDDPLDDDVAYAIDWGLFYRFRA